MSNASSPSHAAGLTRLLATRPTRPNELCPAQECSICYDSLTTVPPPVTDGSERAVTIVNCGHVFGQRCLAAWMRGHRTCPLCRIGIFTPAQEWDSIQAVQDVGGMRVTLGVSVPAGRRIEVRVANANPWTMRRRSFHFGMDNGDDSSEEEKSVGDDTRGRDEAAGRRGFF
jgi:hypothetical protein